MRNMLESGIVVSIIGWDSFQPLRLLRAASLAASRDLMRFLTFRISLPYYLSGTGKLLTNKRRTTERLCTVAPIYRKTDTSPQAQNSPTSRSSFPKT